MPHSTGLPEELMKVLGSLSMELTWSVRCSLDKVSLLLPWNPQRTSNFSGEVTLHMSLRKTFAKSKSLWTIHIPLHTKNQSSLQQLTKYQSLPLNLMVREIHFLPGRETMEDYLYGKLANTRKRPRVANL